MKISPMHVLTALQIPAVCILLWMLVKWQPPWNAVRYIGTILIVVGISLAAIARYQLGKSFTVRAEARNLVTHGLYSKIRNPIYVFGVVTLIGLILVVQKPVLWVVLVALVIVQVARARREAQMLEKAFGDAYREYRNQTWF